MILRQFLHSDPVAASYLFGCGGRAAAAVVDPLGDLAPYLEAAAKRRECAFATSSTRICTPTTSPRAARWLKPPVPSTFCSLKRRPIFRSAACATARCLNLATSLITVLHTPGHTPEHISLLVTDRTRADEPWFALTGHTLMVGDLGRTELATSAEEGARALFRSVQRLKALPEHLEILPGAYSGSVCGRSLSGKPTSTIGFEKRYNKAFRIGDEAEFVRAMLADIPPAPPQAAEVRAVNSGRMAAAE